MSAEGWTVTATLGKEGYRTDLAVRRHRLVADEPTDKGGDDAGPCAFEFLACALATCTAATMRIYASHKGFTFDGVEIEIQARRRTPSELKEAGEGAKTAVIRKKIRILGNNLTDEQRERMMQIAEKCPVNKTLLEGAEIHAEAL